MHLRIILIWRRENAPSVRIGAGRAAQVDNIGRHGWTRPVDTDKGCWILRLCSVRFVGKKQPDRDSESVRVSGMSEAGGGPSNTALKWGEPIMSTSLFDLTGRTALVTGSTTGIGFALARGLAQAGAQIVVNRRDPQRAESAAERLRADGLRASASCFDVMDPERVSPAIDLIEADLGPIDILINNAGIQKRAPLTEMSLATWDEVIRVNLTGVFVVGQAVGRRMVARRRGKIINICSLMSEVARKTIALYTAAKGAVKQLTRAMCVEWAGDNIQVNGIGPGYFTTPMNEALVNDPNFDGWIRSRTPAGRWGRPEELVGAAIFLSSSASDFVNGQILYVDGGVLASL
jgi:gluconate 5-dehydrogenase